MTRRRWRRGRPREASCRASRRGREAKRSYEGFRGYQPLLVTWAETALVLADYFRDGNVPPSKGSKVLVDEAHESVPSHPDG